MKKILITLLIFGFTTASFAQDLNASLCDACSIASLEKIELLLQQGANVNYICGPGKETPLLVALKPSTLKVNEIFEVVKLLLEYGANPNVKDMSGYTPLSAAAAFFPKEQRETLLKLLLKHDAKHTLNSD